MQINFLFPPLSFKDDLRMNGVAICSREEKWERGREEK
jgi:hypothetical protein